MKIGGLRLNRDSSVDINFRLIGWREPSDRTGLGRDGRGPKAERHYRSSERRLDHRAS